MKDAKSLIGLPIIGQVSMGQDGDSSLGSVLGHVRDLLWDTQENQVVALVLTEEDSFWLVDAEIVPWQDVQGLSENLIYVESSRAKTTMHVCKNIQEMAEVGRVVLLSRSESRLDDSVALCVSCGTHLAEDTGHFSVSETEGYQVQVA